jgi:hypothetical protein
LSTAGAAFGGEATAVVVALEAPGTDTLIPHAVAAAPGVRAGPLAPADPISSRKTADSRAMRTVP